MRIGQVHLNTAGRLQGFLELMHRLNYSKLLGPAPEIAQSSIIAVKQSDTARSVAHIAPLRINVSGLTTRSIHPSRANHLELSLVDSTCRLRPFLQSLRGCFSAAGFPLLNISEEALVKVIHAKKMLWHSPALRTVLPNGECRYYRRYTLSQFDVRELLKMYENTIWAKDVPLERMSLEGIGMTGRNSEGVEAFKPFPEVDSVALP